MNELTHSVSHSVGQSASHSVSQSVTQSVTRPLKPNFFVFSVNRMCKLTPVLLGVSLVMALLGYHLYVPLPSEDFKQPISLHLELAGIKSIDLLVCISDFQLFHLCFYLNLYSIFTNLSNLMWNLIVLNLH